MRQSRYSNVCYFAIEIDTAQLGIFLSNSRYRGFCHIIAAIDVQSVELRVTVTNCMYSSICYSVTTF
jgi:hypothetical protein